MMNTHVTYHLEELQDGHAFTRLVKTMFSSSLTAYEKIGEGFYAHVYALRFPTSPYSVVAKCYHHSGRAHAEAQQLRVLKAHAIVAIPEVYADRVASEAFPCDTIIMEYLSGIPAAHITFPDMKT